MPGAPVLFGILVGGQSRRMGGVPKGRLDAGGKPLVVRTVELCRAVARARFGSAGPDSVALIGDSRAYPALAVQRIGDEPTGAGPLGGLGALLAAAVERRAPLAGARAVDLPHLEAALIERLLDEQLDALALAPRQAERWQPLCARYRAAEVLPVVQQLLARGERALQAVFSALGVTAVELELRAAERAQLQDWDTPADVLAFPVRTGGEQGRGP
jgi:molybdopterin-guanine dinucleotide biosynthesis protein A